MSRITNKHILIFILLSLEVANVAFLGGCKRDSPTEPPLRIDSTSHMVLWRTDTIGYGGALKDIAIISEDNIWAVGEIYLKDSTGQIDRELYNVLQWDGLRWNPRRLYFYFGGVRYLRSCDAILAFGPDDVWLACNAPRHWDGQSLNNVDVTDLVGTGQINAMCGKSSTDFYVAGSNGTFAHFDGQRFTKIATGVQSEFWDMTGAGEQIYIGSFDYDNQIYPSGVFSYSNSRFRYLFPDTVDHSSFATLRNAFGLWLSPQGHLWVVGEANIFQPLNSHTPLYSNDYILKSIRGTADNDIWAGGDRGSVLHYNGSTWRKYSAAELGTTGINYVLYNRVAVKSNTVALVGWTMNPDYSILTLGKRLQ